ncbi:MAG: V-type ATPase subunit [Thermodesulfovibrionales bacterium]|nr:V-type ATPase subunit [Thermodesulfovibrionales bacterium]
MRKVFLTEPPQCNYPEEYFISRIRGGRSRLVKDWNIPLYSPDLAGFIKTLPYEFSDSSYLPPLLKRYRWLYSEMNERLRNVFWPYFLFFELKTLITCLRLIKVAYYDDAAELLRISLLSKDIKDNLLSREDFGNIIKKLIELFYIADSRFSDGADIFHKQGLKGFERFIYETCLKYLLSIELNRHIKAFIIYQIDSRNITALYRTIKWDIRTLPEFIPGGEVKIKDLERIIIKRDLVQFSTILKKLTGLSGESIEDLLLKGLSGRLRKNSYEPDGTGLILYHLWSLYIELRNLGTLLSATGIERAELRDEIL